MAPRMSPALISESDRCHRAVDDLPAAAAGLVLDLALVVAAGHFPGSVEVAVTCVDRAEQPHSGQALEKARLRRVRARSVDGLSDDPEHVAVAQRSGVLALRRDALYAVAAQHLVAGDFLRAVDAGADLADT